MNFFNRNLFQLSQSFSIITVFFNHHNLFQLSQSFQSSQSFSVITIFFNHHNLFQSSQSFSVVTIFLNYHSLLYYNLLYHNLFYHNLFQSLYNLSHCFYENKPMNKFHHLTRIFYRQIMTKIFCQFHMFLIYVFYFGFFSFCV